MKKKKKDGRNDVTAEGTRWKIDEGREFTLEGKRRSGAVICCELKGRGIEEK